MYHIISYHMGHIFVKVNKYVYCTCTVTGVSLDLFSLGNHAVNRSRLIPVSVYVSKIKIIAGGPTVSKWTDFSINIDILRVFFGP